MISKSRFGSRFGKRGQDGGTRGSSFTQYSGLLAQNAARLRMEATMTAAAAESPDQSPSELRLAASGGLPEHVTPSEMVLDEDMVRPSLKPVRVHVRSPGREVPRSRGVLSRGSAASSARSGRNPLSVSRSKKAGKGASAEGRSRRNKRSHTRGAASQSDASRALSLVESASSTAQGESVERLPRSQRRAAGQSGGKSKEKASRTRRPGSRREGSKMKPGSAKGESVERVGDAGSGHVKKGEGAVREVPMASAAGGGGSKSAGRSNSSAGLTDSKRTGSSRSKKSSGKKGGKKGPGGAGGGDGDGGGGGGGGGGSVPHPHVPAARESRGRSGREEGDGARRGNGGQEAEPQGCFANFWGTNRKKEKKAKAPQAPKILAPEIPKEKGQGCGIQCGCW